MAVISDLTKLAKSVDLSGLRQAPAEDLSIVIVGAGAIGGSVGAWVAAHHEPVCFLDRGEIAAALRAKGVTTYQQGAKEAGVNVKVKVIDDLAEVPDADVVAIAVKNYSLEPVAKMVREKLGDRPWVIGLQNGVVNQDVLPRYFSKVIYCVISYNAWCDEPGVIGYQKKGPLIFGTAFNEAPKQTAAIAAVFGKGVETAVIDHIHDAAHNKLAINLANSLTTLVGHGFKPISDPALFQRLLSNLAYEGVQIIKASGYRECKLGGMPSWALIAFAAKAPRALTKIPFERNVKKMVMSSMAQDVLQRGGADNELETINGYLLRLADRHGIRAPYNRAVYDLCRREFAKPHFEPLDVTEVWQAVQEEMRG
jgi:2-dehydropantoate 2-reductase